MTKYLFFKKAHWDINHKGNTCANNERREYPQHHLDPINNVHKMKQGKNQQNNNNNQ